MKNRQKWVSTTLLSEFNASLSANLSYLHSTVSWTVTILTAGLFVILLSDEFPNELALASANFLLVFLFHFAIRSGKAYLNVVRYGMLEKEIVKFELSKQNANDNDTKCHSEDFEKLKEDIVLYHCSWASPLARTSIVRKVLFELGFFYFLSVNMAVCIYISHSLGWNYMSIIINLTALIFLIIEFFVGFMGSNYLKQVHESSNARSIR